MDFEFTEDQNLLAEAVQKFMTTRYGTEQRRAILKTPGAWSRDVWSALTEIGLVGMLVPSEQGGLGSGPIETMLAMNAFGAGILLEPYWSSAVLATTLLKKLGGPQSGKLLEGLATGEQIAVLAHAEPGARYDQERVATTARKAGGGWSLSGAKAVVLGAGAATTLLVSARTGAGEGVSVFAIPRTLGGVRVREYPTMDGRGAGDTG